MSTNSSLFFDLSPSLCGALFGSAERRIAEPHEDQDWLGAVWASTQKPTLEEFYWLAGAFEGEGSLSATRIRMSQNDPEIPYRVQSLFHVLSVRRKAQARRFLRISRSQEPPPLDPSDPTRLLWDGAPDADFEALG